MTAPKLFISYSWSTAEHEQRVVSLASELRDSGVDVILDKWDLREGQDAHAFMESMVTDPAVKKVLLVCDAPYVEKANSRSGGVGAEAQIISPELYASANQTKFVALVLEWDADGKPLVPVYYKSRIHIDYSQPGKESDSFDRLLRWIFDKPLHVKPPLGNRPSFLEEGADDSIMRTATQLRRANTAIREGRSNCAALVADYFNSFAHEMEKLRMRPSAEPLDELVFQSISSFTPYRNEVVQLIDDLALHRPGEETAALLHRWLEKLFRYTHRPDGVTSWREVDFDNYRFLSHELFLYVVAVLLRHERFAEASRLLCSEYYCPHLADYGRADMVSYTRFYDPPQTLEHRNSRLGLRRVSLHADLLKERCIDLPVSFSQLMQADFVLFLREECNSERDTWWPVTLLYAGRFAARFELFARAKSRAYFEAVRPVLAAKSVAHFRETVAEFSTGKRRAPRWQFDSLDVARLSGVEELATRD